MALGRIVFLNGHLQNVSAADIGAINKIDSIAASGTLTLGDANATTVTLGGSGATTINVGGATTATMTIGSASGVTIGIGALATALNLGLGATNVYIGTNATGSVNIGTGTTPTINIGTSASTAQAITIGNAQASTAVNIVGQTINVGHTSATANVNIGAAATTAVTIGTSAPTVNIGNSASTAVNIGTSATAVNIGTVATGVVNIGLSSAGKVSIKGDLEVMGVETIHSSTTVAGAFTVTGGDVTFQPVAGVNKILYTSSTNTLAPAGSGVISANSVLANTKFQDTTTISTAVTSTNLNILTGGGSTTLHSHPGLVPQLVYTAGASVTVGHVVGISFDAGGLAKAYHTVITATDVSVGITPFSQGLALSTVTVGNTFSVTFSGTQSGILDTCWDTAPTTSAIGKTVYASATPGNLTLTPPFPSSGSNWVNPIGTLVDYTTGSATVLVQPGTPYLAVA